MKMFTIKSGLASMLALLLFVSSCSKDSTQAVIPEGTTVRLNIGEDFAKTAPAKAASAGRMYASSTQTVEIPFDNQYTLVASLTAEAAPASGLKASNRAATVSIGTDQKALKQGTIYYVAIFDAAGGYKETKSFTQGNAVQDFAIEKGKYTFVIYASGSNKTLPSIAAGTKLNAVNFEGLTADQDFMLDQVAFEVKEGQNILNADLEHLFTQVTLKFDASAIGTVSSISGATIEPSNTAVDVNLADGTLAYKGNVSPVAFKLKNTSGTVINSDSTFIATAATTTGKISLSGVSIGGSVAKAISSSNWSLRPGVKYVLEFKLKKPTEVNIGGEVWALGNLVYNNGVYGFAATNDAYGNYWFPGYEKPKVFGVTDPATHNNQEASRKLNGGSADPCSLVLPLNTWKLPTKAEFDRLIANTGQNGVDNPKTPNKYGVGRYVGSWDGTNATNTGMFFGTQVNPGAQRDKYLYLPYGGAYHNNNTGDAKGQQGYYLLENLQSLHLTSVWGTEISAATATTAYQIRCVKR